MANPNEFIEAMLERRIRDGAVYISDDDKRRYVIENLNPRTGSMTLRRERPKVRGKAARREARRSRTATRNPQQERRMEEARTPADATPSQVQVNEARLEALEKQITGLINLVYHLEGTLKEKEQLDQQRHEAALEAVGIALGRLKFPRYAINIRVPFTGRIVQLAILAPEGGA